MIDKVIFSSGGSKGFVYIGVIKFLEELNLLTNVNLYLGTSIGSLFAMLSSIGYTYTDMCTHVMEFKYENHQSIDVNQFLMRYGFDNFDGIRQFITDLLAVKNISKDITFERLYRKTGKKLYINALCLNTKKNTYFGYDTFPNMPVITAIQASMAIPIIFNCVEYENMTYVDGGITGEYIPSSGIIDDYTSLLCVNLYQEYCKTLVKIDSVSEYILQIIQCVCERVMEVKHPKHEEIDVIHVFKESDPTCFISVFDLNITPSQRDLLISIGYDKTKEWHTRMTTLADPLVIKDNL